MNLWLVFITGLTTGGLTCLAMQGGLLASVIATQKDQEIKRDPHHPNLKSFDRFDWMPVGMFLGSKLVVHILLGFLLGLVGSVLTMSLGVSLFFQLFAAFFMFAAAMNLLDVHPIFRFVVLQPPKFLNKYLKNTVRAQAFFAPALLGFLTVFIPCGVTQAMGVLAIQSGNPVSGALTMGVFVLGTLPMFALVGLATARLSENWRERFLRVAAYALLIMAVYGANGVLTVLGSPITIQRLVSPVTGFFSAERFAPSHYTTSVVNGVQLVTINVHSNRYEPDYVRVRQGVPVELNLVSNGAYGCATAFVFREFGIATYLKPTDRQSFSFTPTKKGTFTFACSMGMYYGKFEVI
jgi:uncharacterized protein